MIAAILVIGGRAPLDAAEPEPPSFSTHGVASLNGHTIQLEDRRELVLPHIMEPGADRFEPFDDRLLDRKAARILGDLVIGRALRVDLLSPGRDRYGRLRGRLRPIAEGGDEDGEAARNTEIASRLVALGTVRVMPEPGADPDYIATLYRLESEARQADRGFWRDTFRIRRAEPYDGEIRRFQIVEGKVRRVSDIGRRTHLEFGEDWRNDFTVGIPDSLSPVFRQRGTEIESLEGKRIRARGYVRHWNGAFLEITDPTQIEVLE